MLFNSRTLLISLFIVFSLGCSSTAKKAPSTLKGQKSLEEETKLVLLPVGFPDDSALLNVKHECVMPAKVKNAVIDTSSNFNIAVKSQEAKEPANINGFDLKIDFIDIIPHRWRFPSVRPSSTATFILTLNKDGKAISSTENTISSGVAFGACERLEKISIAAGRYAIKWASIHM